jgi:uncharacterized membrane protein YkoI
MTDKLKPILIAVAAVGALAAGGAAIAAAAGGGDDGDKPITGSALERAKAAALADTPGRVTETEVGDEEGYYEVEVTRDDGSQVDVHLDRDFRVVGAEGDDGGADDRDEAGED